MPLPKVPKETVYTPSTKVTRASIWPKLQAAVLDSRPSRLSHTTLSLLRGVSEPKQGSLLENAQLTDTKGQTAQEGEDVSAHLQDEEN